MVAIAILGMSVSVILSAQGGLSASNRSAANMGQAVELGRCKMSEIEENLLKLGYQEIDQLETGIPCCLDATPPNFTCDTRVEKIELPNQNGGNSLTDGGGLVGASSAMLGPNNVAGGPGLNLDIEAGVGPGGLSGMTSQLTGGAGADGLISMVMGMLYPSLKPMYEASIRRITVTVKWKEGPVARELPLTQFITNPQRGGFAGSALQADGGAMDFAAPATTGTGTGNRPSTNTSSSGGTK